MNSKFQFRFCSKINVQKLQVLGDYNFFQMNFPIIILVICGTFKQLRSIVPSSLLSLSHTSQNDLVDVFEDSSAHANQVKSMKNTFRLHVLHFCIPKRRRFESQTISVRFKGINVTYQHIRSNLLCSITTKKKTNKGLLFACPISYVVLQLSRHCTGIVKTLDFGKINLSITYNVAEIHSTPSLATPCVQVVPQTRIVIPILISALCCIISVPLLCDCCSPLYHCHLRISSRELLSAAACCWQTTSDCCACEQGTLILSGSDSCESPRNRWQTKKNLGADNNDWKSNNDPGHCEMRRDVILSSGLVIFTSHVAMIVMSLYFKCYCDQKHNPTYFQTP